MKQYKQIDTIDWNNETGQVEAYGISSDQLNELAKEGWEVNSVSWRGTEMISVLLEKNEIKSQNPS